MMNIFAHNEIAMPNRELSTVPRGSQVIVLHQVAPWERPGGEPDPLLAVEFRGKCELMYASDLVSVGVKWN